jgi:hypothetical protein
MLAQALTDAMQTLKRDLKSTVRFLVFVVVYFLDVVLVTRHYYSSLAAAGTREQTEMAFGLTFGVLVIQTLIASLGHVLAFGWLRAKLPEQQFSVLLLLQSAVALMSASISRQELPFVAIFIAPGLVTLAAYGIAHRISTARVRGDDATFDPPDV